MNRNTWIAAVALASLADAAAAQENDAAAPPPPPKSLEERVRDLEQQLEIIRLQAIEEPEPLTAAPAAGATSANVFNPTITVAANGLARVDDHPVAGADGRIDSQFVLREAEVDLRASIDPFADGVVILAFASENGRSLEVEVEEGFATIKRLPIPLLDEPPWGLKLKIGRFRTEVGRVNRLHLHDLPQATRPLVTDEFFGDDGYIANGLSAQFFVPTPFDDDSVIEATAQVLTGGGTPVADGPVQTPAVVGNLRWFRTFAEAHNVDLALVYYFGFTDASASRTAHTFGADLLYKWKPLRSGENHSLVIGGEVLGAIRQVGQLVDVDGNGLLDATRDRQATPFGYFAFAQFQTSATTYLGVRWDDTGTLDGEATRRRAISGWLTWYPSEFLRLRAGYEHRFSDLPEEDDRNTALAELNFIFGAHPPEPFWVNK